MLFRPNTLDSVIWESVVTNNEYKLAIELTGKTIVDIGAHIGAFSYLCYTLGASKIYAFEPDIDNYKLYIQNTKDLPVDIQHYRLAIWSDTSTLNLLKNTDANTGTPTLIKNLQDNILIDANAGNSVQSIAIDNILADLPDTVELCKIDCEYSEWKILPATDKWHKFRYIVGEWHGGEMEDAETFIRKHTGFTNVKVEELVKSIGLFWCWKDGDVPPFGNN